MAEKISPSSGISSRRNIGACRKAIFTCVLQDQSPTACRAPQEVHLGYGASSNLPQHVSMAECVNVKTCYKKRLYDL